MDRFRVRAAVAGKHMQLRNGHVELGIPCVFQMQKLSIAFAQIHVHEAQVAADTMLLMHYRVANAEFREIAQPAFQIRTPGVAPTRARPGGGGIQLVLGDDRDVIEQKAAGERPCTQRERLMAQQEFGKVSASAGTQLMGDKVIVQGFASAWGFSQQQHAAWCAGKKLAQVGERIVGFALDR
jgi:hypothetical protein